MNGHSGAAGTACTDQLSCFERGACVGRWASAVGGALVRAGRQTSSNLIRQSTLSSQYWVIPNLEIWSEPGKP
eukprot:2583562-Prymnesium_polylepis.1